MRSRRSEGQLELFEWKSLAKPRVAIAKNVPRRTLRTAGLFAGVGGLELGLARAGHETAVFCEIDAGAKAVLKARFPGIPCEDDVRHMQSLPPGTQLLAGGFPCQDLSQAGKTAGIEGARSGLVGEVFRLLEKTRVPFVLLENVPFMLQLSRGRALEVIVQALENLGYRWAYRIIDTRAFGLPQRRERIFLLATLDEDPRNVLFASDAGEPDEEESPRGPVAYGFYWTEGIRGLGWAVDAVPTLKGGSTIGIPSPPAILLPSGSIVKPDLRDTERLQGFPVDWTKPASLHSPNAGLDSTSASSQASPLNRFQQRHSRIPGAGKPGIAALSSWVPGEAPPCMPQNSHTYSYGTEGSDQSSSSSPETLPNSAVLCVITVRVRLSAIEAINRSFGPISLPPTESCALTTAYQSAASLSNGRLVNHPKNSSSFSRSSAGLADFCTP